MYPAQTTGNTDSLDSFDPPTEREIIGLWQSYRAVGLSEKQAWDAILAGIALGAAFADGRSRSRLVQ